MNSFEKKFEGELDLAGEQNKRESKIYLSNGAILGATKERFNKGEGHHRTFDASEVNSIKEANRKIQEIVEAENQEYSNEEKLNLLKKTLFGLAKKINSEISIPQERIDIYVEKRWKKMLSNFDKFQSISGAVDYLDSSGIFSYKIRTSGDEKIPLLSQEELDRTENIAFYLNNLFSQSIYYISPSGVTLRLKLFEIKSPTSKPKDIIQPPMEQIYFNDKAVDYTDRNKGGHKEVVKLADVPIEKGKYVFEILTPEFKKQITQIEKIEDGPINSGVDEIKENGRVYINVPEGSILHSGWQIVGMEKLKNSSS